MEPKSFSPMDSQTSSNSSPILSLSRPFRGAVSSRRYHPYLRSTRSSFAMSGRYSSRQYDYDEYESSYRDEDDSRSDWANISDPKERRKVQNRNAQRKFRKLSAPISLIHHTRSNPLPWQRQRVSCAKAYTQRGDMGLSIALHLSSDVCQRNILGGYPLQRQSHSRGHSLLVLGR